jgi:sigma-B regulation protein RsbU (phosphoserine phosphatase)
VVDIKRGRISLARAGHPYPVLLSADGTVREVQCNGSLLGIPDMPADFEEVTVPLAPGDKLLLYTDGMEDVLLTPATQHESGPRFTPVLQSWAKLNVDELIRAVNDHLDGRAGSLNPTDDATLLALEVMRS